ncbi:MAG: hypothetical protein NZM29_02190, partial [Nitrospira sp.]|nr:hypothetical protein [Nitrospira sp.]
NGYVTDGTRTVVRALAGTDGPFRPILDRIAERESQWPEGRRTNMVSTAEMVPAAGSVLALGIADQRKIIERLFEESCGKLVRLGDEGFSVDGRSYEGPEMAVLFTCRRAQVPGSVVTVLYGMSGGAVEKASQYLFYYGWHSYVIFKNGVVIRRGLWQEEPETKEVRIDEAR